MNSQVLGYTVPEFLLGREIPFLQRVTQAQYLHLHLGKPQSLAACVQQFRTCSDVLQLCAQQPLTTVMAHGATFCPSLVRSVWELQLSLLMEFLEEGNSLTFFQRLMMTAKNPDRGAPMGNPFLKGRNLLVCKSLLFSSPESFYFPKKERAKKPWTLILWKLWNLEQVWAQAAAGALCADIPANASLELNLWNHLLMVSTCPRGGGSVSKPCSPSTSSTVAWVRNVNGRVSLGCVPGGLTPSFCREENIGASSAAAGWVLLNPRDQNLAHGCLNKTNTQAGFGTAISRTLCPYKYVGQMFLIQVLSLNKISPNLLTCITLIFQSALTGKLSPLGCHL